MPRPLKVYRTPIGFHDAYIAVPTKKAAIEAWGAGSDIFQRGEAEEVTDSKLIAEPLASPGVVVKRLRGTSADHMAALAASRPHPTNGAGGKASKAKAPKPQPKPKPRPSRTAVEEAEAAIASARQAHEAELAKIKEREEALARERRDIEHKHRQELDRLEKLLVKAQSRYDAAIRKWRG
jgi:hypothetical protein